MTANDGLFQKTSVNRQTKILSYVLMTVIGIILIIPLLWMVFTSLKPMEEIVRYPPTFFPEKSYGKTIWIRLPPFPFGYARNTLFITVLVVIGNVLSNSFIAYGFAKLDFPGKKLMFALVLSTMMIGVCNDDPSICIILQDRLGRYLFAPDRSIVLRQCVQYISDASILLIDQ